MTYLLVPSRHKMWKEYINKLIPLCTASYCTCDMQIYGIDFMHFVVCKLALMS